MRVTLEWCGKEIEGAAEGLETHHGRVRASADATMQAALAATGKDVHFDLVGVKSVRAFDGWVVILRVTGRAGSRSYRLLGSASCEQERDLPRAAALAVLDATNRLLERHVDR